MIGKTQLLWTQCRGIGGGGFENTHHVKNKLQERKQYCKVMSLQQIKKKNGKKKNPTLKDEKKKKKGNTSGKAIVRLGNSEYDS